MKRVWGRLLIAVLLAGLAFWSWRLLHPNPEKVIRQRLEALAKAACFTEGESHLARLAQAQQLTSFFTADVQVSVDLPGHSRQTWNGIDELREAALAAAATVNAMKVHFFGINVIVGADRQSASVELTAEAALPGDKGIEVQEMKLTMKKIKNDWLIRQVEGVRTLK